MADNAPLKVALVHARVSNNTVPPLGLLSIAAYLERDGIEARVWDPPLCDNGFEGEIARFAPDIIGVSVMTAQYARAGQIVKLLKKKIKQAVYVCGGPHVSALPEESLEGLDTDIAVIGEGELSMSDICAAHMDNRGWESIEGIAYRRSGGIVKNAPRKLIEELDRLPEARRELLSAPFGWYLIPPGVIRGDFNLNTTTMITSRGCPYNCSFCASKVTFGTRYRKRSVGNVVREIRYLVDTYNVKGIWFLDDIFTCDREWVKELCLSLARNGLRLKWSCQTRVEHIDRDILGIMKSAGCVQVELGVESGSERILKKYNKDLDHGEIKEKFAMLKAAGLRSMANFIIGHPEENEEDIESTFRLALRLNPDYTEFNLCTPYPGSALYRTARDRGWLHEPRGGFGPEWSEHFARKGVMKTGIDHARLFKMRAGMQRRFLLRNYGKIIRGFIASPRTLTVLLNAILIYMIREPAEAARLAIGGEFDVLIWNLYTCYSWQSRKKSVKRPGPQPLHKGRSWEKTALK
ncbi:MAG: radical SAM protein [Elusimicrobia bacterium]|nr:radical SAM protein [Elusimicrobiota bacterium]